MLHTALAALKEHAERRNLTRKVILRVTNRQLSLTFATWRAATQASANDSGCLMYWIIATEAF